MFNVVRKLPSVILLGASLGALELARETNDFNSPKSSEDAISSLARSAAIAERVRMELLLGGPEADRMLQNPNLASFIKAAENLQKSGPKLSVVSETKDKK